MIRRTFTFCLLVATVISAALPAEAQSDDAVNAKIEQLLGRADAFAESFKLLTEAMRFGDPVTVAGLAQYPLTIQANGETYDVQTSQDLLDNYDTLIMQDTQTAVAEQDYAALFVNSDGVMFAGGALWMTLVCDDDGCNQSHWAINAINN